MAIKNIVSLNAPRAIGTYSQAIVAGQFLYVSGQLPLEAESMLIIDGGLLEQVHRVFNNIQAIVQAAGANMQQCVKVNISMVDLEGFDVVNKVMAEYFAEPYPARACVGVASLPKNALIEVESIFYLGRV